MLIDNGGSNPITGHFRVLMIEDDPLDARLVRELMRDADSTMELVHVTSVGAAGPHLRDATIDAVLLDLHLPDFSGLQAVAAVHAGALGQPIVVLTGRSESDLAVEALRLGAQDYLIKDALDAPMLSRAIRHAIERQRLLSCMRDSVRASSTNETDLRQLLLQGTEALLVVGPGGAVEFANVHAEELFGLDSRELMARPFDSGAVPGVEMEIDVVRPDGSRVPAEVRCVNVMWRGRPALLVSLRDISERRSASEQQVRFDLLTGFLSNMSHELRTPLAAVYQFVSNVRDGVMGEVNEEQHEHLGSALRNVDEVLSMVANLLEVARAQGGKLHVEPRVMHLRDEVLPVCHALAAVAAKAGVQCDIDLPSSLSTIVADPARVRQITSNLVENAIKFTPRGGLISIVAHDDQESGRVILVVADTGCGVPPEHLNRIFERLHQVPDTVYQTRRGLGLGLYITRELVRGLGGTIRVRSEPGCGSQFEIALPMFAWDDVLGPMGIPTPPPALHALVVSVKWSGGGSDEPIPGGPIAALRSQLERVVRHYGHAIVPPVPAGHSLQLGAVAMISRRVAERLGRSLVTRIQADPTLSQSGLEFGLQVFHLTAADRGELPPDFSPALDRSFKQKTPRGSRCKTPA